MCLAEDKKALAAALALRRRRGGGMLRDGEDPEPFEPGAVLFGCSLFLLIGRLKSKLEEPPANTHTQTHSPNNNTHPPTLTHTRPTKRARQPAHLGRALRDHRAPGGHPFIELLLPALMDYQCCWWRPLIKPHTQPLY
jgi:hypothetical protein